MTRPARRWGLAAAAAAFSAVTLQALLVPCPAPAQQVSGRIFLTGPKLRVPAALVVRQGMPYVSSTDLAAALGATKKWSPQSRRLELRYGESGSEHRVEFVVGAPVVLVDDAAMNLPAAVLLEAGIAYVSVAGLAEALSPTLPGGARWDEEWATLFLGESDAGLTQLDITDQGAHTTLIARSALPPHLAASDGRFRIEFPDAAPGAEFQKPSAAGLIASIRMDQTETALQVHVEPAAAAVGYRVEQSGGSWNLVFTADSLDVHTAGFTPIGGVTAFDLSGVSDDDLFRPYRRVVIDPAHGGWEQGATGELVEEDIALEVAEALRLSLEEDYGYEVVLTREDDEALSADRRAEIVNASGADLCIALHADASFTSRVRGRQIIVFRGGNVSPVLAREFAGRRVEVLPWTGVQGRHRAASAILAAALAAELGASEPLPVLDRPFRTLSSLDLPAVAIECGFLTNREDAAALASPENRAELARAIARGIDAFVHRLRGQQEL